MEFIFGFDPGGAGAFGWCVATNPAAAPLGVRECGVVSVASEAADAAMEAVGRADEVVAAGIDAPLFWVPAGDRAADRKLRSAICSLGAPSGTVQHVNSLRGACLIQGILVGLLLRQRMPRLPISESHPKAMLWLTRVASRSTGPSSIALSDIAELSGFPQLAASDHERDAAIAALSAWAMLRRPTGWHDLHAREPNAVSPLTAPLAYWMPSF